MYAYSRIKKVSLKRSKSLDLTNLPPHTPTLSLANYYNSKRSKPNNITTRLDPSRTLEQDHKDEIGEVFGVILGRKYPAPANNNSDKQRYYSSFHSSVKRSFSMRRSTSINNGEGYRRMNRCCCSHQYLTTGLEDDLYQKNHDVKKRSGKLFKVCRSLFGFM